MKFNPNDAPEVVHHIVKPGQIWKTAHPGLLPPKKVGLKNAITYVMIVELKRKLMVPEYGLGCIEVKFLLENGEVMTWLYDNTGDGWLKRFYYMCSPTNDNNEQLETS